MSKLNVDEPKLSPMLTLRIELKERKCEICLFKLCSSKLTITSLTRIDLSFISKRALSLSFPRSQNVWFSKRGGRSLSGCMLGNLNPQMTGNCDLGTSTDYVNFFSSYHWCWKLKNYCEAINNDCMYNASFTVEKAFGVWQSSLIWLLLNSGALNEKQNNALSARRLVKV